MHMHAEIFQAYPEASAGTQIFPYAGPGRPVAHGKFQGNWLRGLAEGKGAWIIGRTGFSALKGTSPSRPHT